MALTPLLSATNYGLLFDPPFDCVDVNHDLVQSILKLESESRCIYAKDAYLANISRSAIESIAPIINFYEFSLDTYTSFTKFFADYCFLVIGVNYGYNKKFVSTLQTSMSYMSSINERILSTKAADNVRWDTLTFTSTNDMMSGNVTAVSTEPNLFANDLIASGDMIIPRYIQFYGTPQGLMQSLITSNALRLLKDQFALHGIDIGELAEVVLNNPDTPLLLSIQKIIYDVALSVTGSKLTDVTIMMRITLPNLESLADLLDTKKLFPTSWQTIHVLNNGESESLYTSYGSLGKYASALTTNMESILTDELAKGSLAFIHSLQQLKNLKSTIIENLINVFSEIEISSGVYSPEFPESSSLSIIPSVQVDGGDQYGTYFLTDFVGAPTGITTLESIEIINNFQNLYDLSALDTALQSQNEAAINSAATDITASSDWPPVMDAYLHILYRMTYEQANLTLADCDLFRPVTTEVGVNAFVESLHQTAQKTDKNDAVDVLEALARARYYGSSMVNAMIEGRNLKSLDINGITTDTRV